MKTILSVYGGEFRSAVIRRTDTQLSVGPPLMEINLPRRPSQFHTNCR